MLGKIAVLSELLRIRRRSDTRIWRLARFMDGWQTLMQMLPFGTRGELILCRADINKTSKFRNTTDMKTR